MTDARTLASARERAQVYQKFCQLFDYPGGESKDDPQKSKLQHDYHLSFDRAANAPACSLHGADYSRQDRNAYYEEIMRFYNYFGLHRAAESDLPDHLHVQLQFMHFLTAYEVECLNRDENVEDLRRAQVEFIQRFLQALVTALDGQLARLATTYSELSTQLVQFLASEIQQLKGREAA